MPKIRENTVFIISDEIVSAEYIPNSLIATVGQPTEEPVVVDVTEGVVTIIAQSGRKKSKPIADSFKRKSSEFYMTTQGGSDGSPHELNFMFSLKLKFKDGKEITAHLGQGNRMLVRNNWWFGSPDSISPLNISPSTLKKEGFNVGDVIKGIVPPKWKGVVSLINEVVLKDLTEDVNVFKIG